MAKHRVIFIEHGGGEHAVEADAGQSIMQCAQENLVPGVLGDCGGCCSCATCHGYVDAQWMPLIGEAGEDERMMLEGAVEVKSNSRLLCQVAMTPRLEGLVVRLPWSQR